MTAGQEPGTTAVGVELVDGRHTPRLLRPGAFLDPRPLPGAAHRARCALVGSQAGLLAGDDLRLTASVGAAAGLELVEPAGLVAYDHRGGRSTWRARVDLAEDAVLLWPGQPFVAARGADTHRLLDVRLARGARMLWRETLVLGRSGESGGSVRSATRVCQEGRELLVEDVDLRDPEERALPGVLGGCRVVCAIGAFGWRPRAAADHPYRTDLAGPGALVRRLGDAAHRVTAELDPVWDAWAAELAGCPTDPTSPTGPPGPSGPIRPPA